MAKIIEHPDVMWLERVWRMECCRAKVQFERGDFLTQRIVRPIWQRGSNGHWYVSSVFVTSCPFCKAQGKQGEGA